MCWLVKENLRFESKLCDFSMYFVDFLMIFCFFRELTLCVELSSKEVLDVEEVDEAWGRGSTPLVFEPFFNEMFMIFFDFASKFDAKTWKNVTVDEKLKFCNKNVIVKLKYSAALLPVRPDGYYSTRSD